MKNYYLPWKPYQHSFMHYYIDGYNLLFRAYGPSVNDLKSHRESLISSLNVKVASLKLDVTVVFDSQYLVGEGSRSHYKHLEICFTPLGITADEYILQQLQFCSAPQREVVVTSDRDLAYKARNYSASTESVNEFLGWLNKRYKKKESTGKKEIFPPPSKKKVEGLSAKKTDDVEKPIEPPVIEKVVLPPKGSIEYYLWQFEEKLNTLKISEPTKSLKPHLKQKSKKIIPKIEHSHLTEEDRWLKIFLDRLKDEES